MPLHLLIARCDDLMPVAIRSEHIHACFRSDQIVVCNSAWWLIRPRSPGFVSHKMMIMTRAWRLADLSPHPFRRGGARSPHPFPRGGALAPSSPPPLFGTSPQCQCTQSVCTRRITRQITAAACLSDVIQFMCWSLPYMPILHSWHVSPFGGVDQPLVELLQLQPSE